MSLLKTGACFTAELELNCPTIVACVAALPVGAPAVPGDLVLGPDNQYHALPTAPVPNGSETKVVAGTNTTVTGSGTVASPYVVSAAAAAVPDGSETKVTGGANVTITGAGTVASPYVVAAVAGAIPDGSETKVTGGTGAAVTGTGTTAAPYTVAVNFATPAQTLAGTSAVLSINPADLYARENMPAQTGLGLVLSAIPAPTASQSNWGVNTLGETLHYTPGVGWKIVADRFSDQIAQPAGVLPTPADAWATAVSLVAPRAGRIVATTHIVVDSAAHYAHAGGLAINGVVKSASNSVNVGLLGTPTSLAGGSSTYQTSSSNSVVAWTGDVAAGTVIAAQGITLFSTGQMRLANLEYTYIN